MISFFDSFLIRRFLGIAIVMLSAISQNSLAADEPVTASPSDKSRNRESRIDWAEIELTGTYPEGTSMPGLFGDLVESLPTCMDRLHQAARDKSIKGVLLHINGVSIGWARLNELHTAIAEVKAWAERTFPDFDAPFDPLVPMSWRAYDVG